jgi:hypothetical protein
MRVSQKPRVHEKQVERILSVRTENRDWCLRLKRLRRVRIIVLRELGKIAL